ncbi:hypothetical protein [Streptomyces xanthochromogenes]|nr:hypothetical protein [Streptomyces xanthochromogenes]
MAARIDPGGARRSTAPVTTPGHDTTRYAVATAHFGLAAFAAFS